MLSKKQEVGVLILWPVLVSVFVIAFHVTLLTAIVLFFVVPAVFLSFLRPQVVKKLLLFSIVLGIPLAIIPDYVMHIMGGWYAGTIFPWRILGQGVIENMLWTPACIYFITIFYEVFFDRDSLRKLRVSQFKYFFTLCFLVLIAFFVVYVYVPDNLVIHHFYLKAGLIVGFIPIIFVALKYPKLLVKFVPVNLYFAYVFLLHELSALLANQWSFPNMAESIGALSIIGLSIPYEEFFFFILFGALTVLSIYELFDDDMK